MTQETGIQSYTTTINLKLLQNKKGKFECVTNLGSNLGLVVVKDTSVDGEFSGKSLIQLPGKPFTAIRFTKINKKN